MRSNNSIPNQIPYGTPERIPDELSYKLPDPSNIISYTLPRCAAKLRLSDAIPDSDPDYKLPDPSFSNQVPYHIPPESWPNSLPELALAVIVSAYELAVTSW